MTAEQQAAQLIGRTASALATLREGLIEPADSVSGVGIVAVLSGHDAEYASRVSGELVGLAAGEHPEPPAAWWATPLGKLCARWFDGSGVVTPSVAAAMLGRHVQRIYQLRNRGVLQSGPEGGVTTASVLRHLAQHDPPTEITVDRLLYGLDKETLLAVREELELLAADETATCEDTNERVLVITTLKGVPIDAQTVIDRIDDAIRETGE